MEDVPYTRVFREAWAWILAAALIGSLLALGVAKMLPRTYQATSTLMLKDKSSSASLFEKTQFSQARVKSYPSFVASAKVIEGVRTDLNLDSTDYTDRYIRRMISAVSLPDTSIVEVTATAPSAELAADMANAASLQMSAVIEAFEDASSESDQKVLLVQIKAATAPTHAISPQTVPIVGLGLLTGLAVGTVVALLRSSGSRRTVAPEDIRRRIGLHLVGQTPKKTRRTPTEAQTRLYLEAASNVLALAGGHQTSFVLVPTRPDPLGATTLGGLVEGFEGVGHATVVLDTRAHADSGYPVLHLQDLAAGNTANLLVEPGQQRGIYRISTTPRTADGPALKALVKQISVGGRIVLLVVDPEASTTISDLGMTLLVVVKERKTKMTDLLMVTSRLKAMGVRPLGVLMTGSRKHSVAVATSWQEPSPTQAFRRPSKRSDGEWSSGV